MPKKTLTDKEIGILEEDLETIEMIFMMIGIETTETTMEKEKEKEEKGVMTMIDRQEGEEIIMMRILMTETTIPTDISEIISLPEEEYSLQQQDSETEMSTTIWDPITIDYSMLQHNTINITSSIDYES